MTTLILMKITDSKKGKILTAIRHLKQVVPLLNSIDLSDLVRDLNLLKRTELLGSKLKGRNVLHPFTVICFFRNSQNE
jgi:hypothetical protein